MLGLFLAVLAAPAHAAPTPYVVGFCADPRTGTAIGAKSLPPGWTAEVTASWHAVDVDCQSTPSRNTGIRVHSVAATRPHQGSASVEFRPPDDVTILGADYYRWMQSADDMFVQALAGSTLTDADGREEHCYPGGCSRGVASDNPFDARNLFVWRAAKPETRLRFTEGGGTCTVPPGATGGCVPVTQSANNLLHVWGGLISLLDSTPPQFTRNPDGPLIDPATPRAGVQALTFAATDKGGGLRWGVIAIDGKDVQSYVLDDNRGACTRALHHAAAVQAGAGDDA